MTKGIPPGGAASAAPGAAYFGASEGLVLRSGAFVRLGTLSLQPPLTISVLARPDVSGGAWTSLLTLSDLDSQCSGTANTYCSGFFALAQGASGGMFGVFHVPWGNTFPNQDVPVNNSVVPPTTSTITSGAWLRVTVVVSAALQNGNVPVALYRDGALVGSSAHQTHRRNTNGSLIISLSCCSGGCSDPL